MKKPKYLYHGSGKKIKVLEPRKPTDSDPMHSKKGVYATSLKKVALGMAAARSAKTSAFKNRKTHVINIIEGWPDLKATVYLHILDPKDFKQNHKDEYLSMKKVKPIKIEEHKVSDLKHLWRKSSKKELKEFLKDREAWRAPGDRKIKAIFFDFDGTISDAKKIAFDTMVRTLDEFGYEFDKEKMRKLLGVKTHLILKGLGLHVKDLQKFRRKFYKYFTKAAIDGGIKPCVSLKPLWELKEGMPLIVVSNSKTSFLRASIKKLKLKGLFRGVYGSEKFSTKDEMLEKLFRKMKIKASEAMYVGDRFSDVQFAREAGCVAVAINNKCAWSSLAVIKKEKPDYIIGDFRELRKVVMEINNS